VVQENRVISANLDGKWDIIKTSVDSVKLGALTRNGCVKKSLIR
jgi:hypothetical protein